MVGVPLLARFVEATPGATVRESSRLGALGQSSRAAGVEPAGEPRDDAYQAADRPDLRRSRDHRAGRLGRHPVGGLDARLPAAARDALADGRGAAGLPALGAVRLVVSL